MEIFELSARTKKLLNIFNQLFKLIGEIDNFKIKSKYKKGGEGFEITTNFDKLSVKIDQLKKLNEEVNNIINTNPQPAI